ncbi:hypothetical protein C6Y62_08020 [Hyphomicrobium sulfonivorans]|nr:hypothetical protein [Hyphomicrobium sulfonivorans]
MCATGSQGLCRASSQRATAPASRPTPSWPGRRITASTGTSLRRVSRMQYGYVESFNGRMRDELLNESLFFVIGHARGAIAAWLTDYNTEQPHSSLG